MQGSTLAEITNNQGNIILDSILHGKLKEDKTPVLWNTSTSTLNWPKQTYAQSNIGHYGIASYKSTILQIQKLNQH
jgi:hypothetical protein